MGSAEFIKRTFGNGYRLKISQREDFKKNVLNEIEMRDLVFYFTDNSTQLKGIEGKLEFDIPFSNQKKLAELFKNLENYEEINVLSFLHAIIKSN